MDDTAFASWPFAAVWGFFLFGALARGIMLYWLGRGARGADARARGWLERPSVARAEVAVRRFGAPVVTACFLTVGTQSAILAAAGVLRMPGRRFTPALLIGASIWATIYATVGWAVIEAFWGREHTRWGVAAVLGLLLVFGGSLAVRRWLTPRNGAGSDDGAGSDHPDRECSRSIAGVSGAADSGPCAG